MVTVLLPWRPAPSRVPAFDAVQRWYRENLDGVEIRTVDSDDAVFSLARCRNLGIASIADPHEVVVIGDADTIPQRGPLLAALAGAASSGRVHLPYAEYHWLGAEGTAEYLAGRDGADCSFELVRGACSGVYVTTPATWGAHGGQDERFRGWGYEDAAWYLAHETLLGEAPRREAGLVFALHHQAEERVGVQFDANAALMQRYRDAAGDALRMRQLVAERPEEASDTASNARVRPGD